MWKVIAITITALASLGQPSWGQSTAPSIEVTVNQSTVYRLLANAKRVSVTQPEIAEVIVAEPNQLVVNGKAVGITSLIVWDIKGNVTTLRVVVTTDVISLRNHLKSLFPKEAIQVSTSGLAIVLRGTVSNEVVYDKVLGLAKGYLPPPPPSDVAPAPTTETNVTFSGGINLPKTGTAFAGGGELAFVEEGGLTDSERWKDKRGIPEILDLLTILDFRQVELNVTVAEVSLTKLREIGLDFRVFGNSFSVATNAATQGGIMNEAVSAIFTYATSRYQIATMYRLFQNRQVTQILAQPNLVIKNGRTGGFLAGGEIPIPIPQSSGIGGETITIEFKPFGVRLDFLPTITWSNSIDLRVFPEVSEIDRRLTVRFAGGEVPGLRVRRSVSRVEMKEGEMLVLSGLLDKRTLRDLTKFPVLGDIPVLGAMFRSTKFRDEDTELIFIITPKIVSSSKSGRKPVLPDPHKFDSPDMRQIPIPSAWSRKPKRSAGASIP